MTNHVKAGAGCLLVGEYCDEGELPANLPVHAGEVVRPQVVASQIDLWARDDGLKEFTVLLRDGRTVAVRGHSLRHVPHAIAGQDVYDIIVRNGDAEMSIALFKSSDVAGIFHGELRSDRRIA